MESRTPYSAYAWGAVAGAIVVLVVSFWSGWMTTRGTANAMVQTAVSKLLVRICAEDMLANPKAVEAMKTKITSNYDDAVRDFWKPTNLPEGVNIPDGWDFRRACGKDIEARMAAGSNKS